MTRPKIIYSPGNKMFRWEAKNSIFTEPLQKQLIGLEMFFLFFKRVG